MSTRISRSLRLLATAQRVSMEDAAATVQGQDGNLSEEELAKVAAKAAESVEAEAGKTDETPTSDATDATNADAVDGSDTTTDSPADGTDVDATSSGGTVDSTVASDDVTASTDETPAGEIKEETITADEVQTPAEEELAKVEDGKEVASSTELEVQSETTDVVDTTEASSTDDSTGEATVDETSTAEATNTAEAELDAALNAGDTGVDAGDQGAIEGPVTDTSVDPTASDDSAAGDVDASVDGSDTAAPANDVSEAADTIAGDPAVADGGVDTATADATAEEPQAPATAPGPQTDASETVQEVVQLTEALAQAQSAEEVVKEAHQSSEELGEIAKTAEFSNEQGGVTMESYAGLVHAIHPYATRLGHRKIDLGITLESFRGKKLTDRLEVSLEDIEAMIDELEIAQPQLERQAIESLDRVVCALKDALPTAANRLKAVLSMAANSSDDKEGATIEVGDGLAAALCINGSMSTDLANDLQSYAQLGRMVIGPFAEAAFRAAKASSMLNNAVNFGSTTVFWEKIGEAVDTVVDPRTTLTRTQLESSLPGGTCLFDQALPPLEATNKVLQKLFDYNGSYAPLETAMATKASGGDSTAPALSSSKIVLIGNALLDVLCEDRICERLSEGQKLWPEAQDALRHLRENLDGAPPEIDAEAGADFSQVAKFVEINYSLATWPLLNYLTNLVLTVNAFVLYAERSLKATPQANVGGVDDLLNNTDSTAVTDNAVDETLPVADTDTTTDADSVPTDVVDVPVVEDTDLQDKQVGKKEE